MFDIHIDFEWFSDVDIKRGPSRYFGAKRQGPLMASFMRADLIMGQVLRWLPGEPCPPVIVEHARAGGRFVAHNAANFERLAWAVMVRDFGWPSLRVEQWRDTMASACAMGLPAALETLAVALGLPQQKDKTGKKLIKLFCVPREDGEFNRPEDFPAEFAQFQSYCDQDVRTEMAVDARLIPLSADEQAAWVLDCVINDRGIRVDRPSVVKAIELVERAKLNADAAIRAATAGAVKKHTAVADLTRWLEAEGVPIAGVAKDDLLEALDLEDLPDHVRRVVELRQAAAKSSVAKLPKFLSFSEGSGRTQHSFRFHGTGPGRWTNMGAQLANLPRPRALYQNAVEEGRLDINQAFEIIRHGDPDLLEAMYGPVLGSPLAFVSDSLRGFLMAAPGHDLLAVDYSGIQGALAAWYADEAWKLSAMKEIIANPKTPDLYRQAAARILGLPLDIVTKKHWARQAVGKTSELALQFQGSISALTSMARNYGIRRRALHDLYPGVWAAADEEMKEKAAKRYEHALRSRNKQESDILSREAWLACFCVVHGWRNTNKAIKASWTTLETAVRGAVRSPGETVTTLRGVQYVVKLGYLWCKLPSGRCICYASPRLKDQVWARLKLADGSWGESEVVDADEARALARKGEAKIEGETSPKVTVVDFVGNGPNVKSMRYALYGGLIMENLCLASERDILLNGMRECEKEGYPIVYHNYDEAVAELPRGVGSIEAMEGFMLRLPGWTEGLPLGAHGWRGKRYRK